MKADPNIKYLIWSIEHSAWWAPAWRGYTPDVSKAGIYNWNEAITICDGANQFRAEKPTEWPNEAMVPLIKRP